MQILETPCLDPGPSLVDGHPLLVAEIGGTLVASSGRLRVDLQLVGGHCSPALGRVSNHL